MNVCNDNKSDGTKSKASSLLSYHFKVDEFAMRGLNKYRNFLQVPHYNGNYNDEGLIKFKNDDDLKSFCATALVDNGCCRAAIFLIYKSGKQRIICTIPGWNDEDEFEYIENIGVIENQDINIFAKFDAELCLHCYGLMIKREKKQWEICEV